MPKKISDLTINNNPADTDIIPYSNGSDATDRGLHIGTLRKPPVEGVENIASLKTREGSFDGQSINVLGYTLQNDGGGGLFYWDEGSTDADDDGTIIQATGVANGRWKRVVEHYCRPEWFGAVGDGTADDTDPINNAMTFCRDSGLALQLSNSYRTTNTLDATGVNIHASKATIIYDRNDNEPAIIAHGSVEDFVAVDSTASIGENKFVSAALSSNVSKGDIVHITSSKKFSAGDRDQGELGQVMRVAGNDIVLHQALNDTYSLSDSPVCRKINATTLNIYGDLSIKHQRTNPSFGRGIEMLYARDTDISVNLTDCGDRSLRVLNVYAPKIDVRIQNAPTAGSGYGIEVLGGTCYGKFTGVIQHARHVITFGSAPAYRSVSWENRVSIYGSGARDSGVFDAHGATGSVYFNDCTAVGGDVEREEGGVQRPTSGVQSLARRTIINNLTVIRCLSAVSFRTEAAPGGSDLLSINGLNGVGLDGNIVNVNTSGAYAGKIYLNDINIIQSNISIALRISGTVTGTVDVNIESLKTDENTTIQRFIEFANDTVSYKNLIIKNIDVRGTGLADTNARFIVITASNDLEALIVEGAIIGDYNFLGRFQAATKFDKFVFRNVHLKNKVLGFRLDVTPGTSGNHNQAIKNVIFDSVFLESKESSTDLGLMDFTSDYVSLETLSVLNSSLHGVKFPLGNATTLGYVDTVFNIGNDFDDAFEKMVRSTSNDDDLIEYHSGSKFSVFNAIGRFAPESKVYGGIGSLFTNVTNGNIYFKTTVSSSNTGWKEITKEA